MSACVLQHSGSACTSCVIGGDSVNIVYAFRMASADIEIAHKQCQRSHACNKHAAHRQKEAAKTDLAVMIVTTRLSGS